MNLKEVTLKVVELTKIIGQYIQSEATRFSTNDVEEKGLHDLVSYVDKEAEKRLVKALSEIVPEAGFIAEESPQLKRSNKLNWIVDPLDGTTNFIHRVPVYSVSIALMDKNELVSGVVYEINLDECFYAWKGGPAFLNNIPIKVSPSKRLEQSLVATGFPYHDYSLMKPYLKLFDDLMKTTRGIRRLGSAAVDLAYVACGRFELFYEYSLKPWDVAAGAFIVQQAGGHLTDFKGGDNYLFGGQIVASNKIIHDEIMKKIQRHFRGTI